MLDVSALTTVTQQGGWTINANNGGEIKLSGLTSLTGTDGINITDTGGSTILDGNLTTLSGVNVTLDGTDTQVANSWITFLNGGLTVTGGAYTLPDLTTLTGQGLTIENGATISLPVLTAGNITLSNGQSLTIQGTLVSMPAAGAAGATINVPQSQSLVITFQNSGTFTGGTTFNVGKGRPSSWPAAPIPAGSPSTSARGRWST